MPAIGGVLTLEPLQDQRPDLVHEPGVFVVPRESPFQFPKVPQQVDEVCRFKEREDGIRIPLRSAVGVDGRQFQEVIREEVGNNAKLACPANENLPPFQEIEAVVYLIGTEREKDTSLRDKVVLVGIARLQSCNQPQQYAVRTSAGR